MGTVSFLVWGHPPEPGGFAVTVCEMPALGAWVLSAHPVCSRWGWGGGRGVAGLRPVPVGCALAPHPPFRLGPPTWMSRPWESRAPGLRGAGGGRQPASLPDPPFLASRRGSRPSSQPLLRGTRRRGHAAGVAPATPGCPATSPRRASRARRGPIREPERKQVSPGQSPPPSRLPPASLRGRLRGANYRNCGGSAPRCAGVGAGGWAGPDLLITEGGEARPSPHPAFSPAARVTAVKALIKRLLCTRSPGEEGWSAC